MDLKLQKQLAAKVLGCSPNRISFDQAELPKIKEAITRADIKALVSGGFIQKHSSVGVSRGRARERHAQRKKGRRRGSGSRKGTSNARLPRKQVWMTKIRSQRSFLKVLKETGNVSATAYRSLYLKAKGGFFRSKRHIQLYLQEHGLFIKKK